MMSIFEGAAFSERISALVNGWIGFNSFPDLILGHAWDFTLKILLRSKTFAIFWSEQLKRGMLKRGIFTGFK